MLTKVRLYEVLFKSSTPSPSLLVHIPSQPPTGLIITVHDINMSTLCNTERGI